MGQAVKLDIPSQDLLTALARFSELTGMAVLADRQLTQGRRSGAIHASLPPRQALSLLLAGSGLMAVYAGTEGFTVQPAQVLTLDERPKGSASAFEGQSFAATLQQDITRVLCRNPQLRPGTYRAVLQLWIGGLGDVQYSHLLASTGDYDRDDLLINELREVVIDRPPPSSMRQPLTILLEPAVLGKSMDCNDAKGGAHR